MTQPPLLNYHRPPSLSRLALASLICGCVAAPGVLAINVALILYAPVAGGSAIAAVVCGILGLRAIAASKGTLRGRAHAIVGLVLGSVILVQYVAVCGTCLSGMVTGPSLPTSPPRTATAPTSATAPAAASPSGSPR